MKIYFAGSIRGGRKNAELYRKIIAALKEKHQVLTEHVGDLSLSTMEDKGDKAIYEQDTAWLRECDVVVAECTQASLGVGYELAYAEAHGKEVHVFYRPKEAQLSAMLSGNERFNIHRYTNEEEILAQVRALTSLTAYGDVHEHNGFEVPIQTDISKLLDSLAKLEKNP